MISISTYDLWDKAGKFRHEQVPLRSARRKSEAQGTISYSVAFFELARSLIQRKEKAGAVQNEGGSEDAMTTEDEQQRQAKTPQKSAIKEKAKPTFVTRSEPVESASSLYARRMREMVRFRVCTGWLRLVLTKRNSARRTPAGKRVAADRHSRFSDTSAQRPRIQGRFEFETHVS